MRRYLFIVNPAAGRGRGEKAAKLLQSAISRDNHRVEIVRTQNRGDATKIARETSADVVVAVGGDGTTNEVGNGLVGTEKKMGVVPTGSGNDLIKTLGIPSSFREALEVVWSGHSARIDAGKVACFRPPSGAQTDPVERLFFNGVGIGFDAAVARQASELQYLRGTLLYLVAVIMTLRRFKAPMLELAVDGKSVMRKEMLLVAVDNGVCAGGGFFLTPEAIIDDGKLDFCAITSLSVASVLRLIPKVLRGRHENVAGVQLGRGDSFAITMDSGTSVHADGEILSHNAVRVTVSTVRGALEVLQPL